MKQWNTDPENLDASITARIPVRYNTDDRYFDSKIQAMPLNGYFNLFNTLLKGIEIRYNNEFSEVKNEISYDRLIYTRPIDEFFSYKYGKLPYRSLKFIFENHRKEYYQDNIHVNYPNDFDYTRIVEIKHATGQKCNSTPIVKEFPSQIGKPFYPIPNPQNHNLYLKYNQTAIKLKNVYFIGRLATYQYLNMDQVVKQALQLFNQIRNS